MVVSLNNNQNLILIYSDDITGKYIKSVTYKIKGKSNIDLLYNLCEQIKSITHYNIDFKIINSYTLENI